jgi:hypothetical protein
VTIEAEPGRSHGMDMGWPGLAGTKHEAAPGSGFVMTLEVGIKSRAGSTYSATHLKTCLNARCPVRDQSSEARELGRLGP